MTPDGNRPGPGTGRLVRAWSLALAAGATTVALVLPPVAAAAAVPVLVVGFLVGLPHGAVDHLVPSWGHWGWAHRAPFLAGYVGLAAATWWALRLPATAPTVLLVLLALSALHFGAGDLMTTRADWSPREQRSWLGGFAFVLARGAPVVLGPMLAWPAPTLGLLRSVVPGFGPVSAPALPVCVGLAVAATVLVVWAAVRRSRWREVIEDVLLWALFLTAPPLLAFGVYFGGWHGLRHTARLVALDPRNDLDLTQGRYARPLRRFLTAAAAPTAVALLAVSSSLVLVRSDSSLTSAIFTALLALTVPHLAVVAMLDRNEWEPSVGAHGVKAEAHLSPSS